MTKQQRHRGKWRRSTDGHRYECTFLCGRWLDGCHVPASDKQAIPDNLFSCQLIHFFFFGSSRAASFSLPNRHFFLVIKYMILVRRKLASSYVIMHIALLSPESPIGLSGI